MRAGLVEVPRVVAERVARITAVREDDGIDSLRAAAMTRGTVARLPFMDSLSVAVGASARGPDESRGGVREGEIDARRGRFASF